MKKTIFVLSLLALIALLLYYIEPDLLDDDTKTVEHSQIQSPSFLRTHFIDVGQADASLLQIIDNDEVINVLIDTGDWNRLDVINYLHKENIDIIDLIIISHPHADHIGQLDRIIENFTVHEVWMNGETSNAQVYASALKAIEVFGVDYYEPTLGETFELGKLNMEVIHPLDLNLGTNDNSLVIRATYGNISFLFTGDVERAGEEQILTRGENVQAHILHVGHHGSNTSSTGNFLEAVNAQTAVYSAAVNSKYGHPDPEIIERLKSRKMDIYGTDKDGTIVIDTDGKAFQIMTEKSDELPPPVANKSCIDVNQASLEELQKIVHITENFAQQLIDLRPFHSLKELEEIRGIGPKKLSDIIEQEVACIGG